MVQFQIVLDVSIQDGKTGVNINGPWDKPLLMMHALDVAKNFIQQKATHTELAGGEGIVLANRLPPMNGHVGHG